MDPSSRPALRAGADEGRAVLLCGPTGVGKSTVGFGLFRDLLAGGRTAAYLDLQQLGFLADLPDGAPDVQKVVAGCVGDLWQQYRAVGARDLVLSGRIQQAVDVRRLRDALGATSLTVCRLRARPAALHDRILARAVGGGPALAGDALLGLGADEAAVVLHEALIDQARLETADVADFTLDTAHTSADAVVRLVKSGWDTRTAPTA